MAPSLTVRGHIDGFVILCDGDIVAGPVSFLQAATRMRELRAARAFAAEELRHVLSEARKEA